MAIDFAPPTVLHPTSVLQAIKTLSYASNEELKRSLDFIRKVYNPPVRGGRRRRRGSKGSLSQECSNRSAAHLDALDAVRADPFERTYVTNWLTALVSRYTESPSSDPAAIEAREVLLSDAAALLAVCSGTSAAGVITRTFSVWAPCTKAREVHVELRDVPLDNQDYGSVGAQTWGGACIMAEMIAECPGRFGIRMNPRKSLRVLELGAGTGLVSLAIASLARQINAESSADPTALDVVATDYYPSVLENLAVNLSANRFGEHSLSSSVKLTQAPLDWSTFPADSSPPRPLDEPFDVAFGADIIYEEQHAVWIKACLELLLRKPSTCPVRDEDGHWFHLIIPLRATHAQESSTIEAVFGAHNPSAGEGLSLFIHEKEIIVCDAGAGKDGEEVEYVYYKIGWGTRA